MKDSDTEVKKSSAVQKILQHPANRCEPEEDEQEAYDEARVRSRTSLTLEFRFADGRRRSFCYAYLAETDFDLGDAGDIITLRFGRVNLIVYGRGLLGLYEKLLDQRARFIQEGAEAEEGARPQNVPYVERIEIERKED